MKVFICSSENQLIPAKVARYSIIQRSSYTEKDISIILETDAPYLKHFHSKPYLRGGRMIMPHRSDMQSFTLLRFYVPELLSYSGKAIVIDPDIFLVRSGLEALEDFNFNNTAIFARKGLQNHSWGSSVLLLDCNKLSHWSLQTFIEGLHKGNIDYDDLINLRLESMVSPLKTKWNEFDVIKEDTILLHTTERLTQPWRVGLKLNSHIKPFFNIIPKEPIYKLFGKDLTVGREHPREEITKFFFNELSQCIAKNIISVDEINSAIRKGFLREDLFEKAQILAESKVG